MAFPHKTAATLCVAAANMTEINGECDAAVAPKLPTLMAAVNGGNALDSNQSTKALRRYNRDKHGSLVHPETYRDCNKYDAILTHNPKHIYFLD